MSVFFGDVTPWCFGSRLEKLCPWWLLVHRLLRWFETCVNLEFLLLSVFFIVPFGLMNWPCQCWISDFWFFLGGSDFWCEMLLYLLCLVVELADLWIIDVWWGNLPWLCSSSVNRIFVLLTQSFLRTGVVVVLRPTGFLPHVSWRCLGIFCLSSCWVNNSWL